MKRRYIKEFGQSKSDSEDVQPVKKKPKTYTRRQKKEMSLSYILNDSVNMDVLWEVRMSQSIIIS